MTVRFSEVKNLTYSELVTNINSRKVAEIKINGTKATGKLTSGKSFESIVPEYTIDTILSNYIIKNPKMKVEIAKDQSWWVSLIPSVILVAMLVVFLVMMMRQGGGSGNVMSFGKSRARMQSPSDKKVTFKDVAGADEEKEELAEIVRFITEYRVVNHSSTISEKMIGASFLWAPAVWRSALASFSPMSGYRPRALFISFPWSHVRTYQYFFVKGNTCR